MVVNLDENIIINEMAEVFIRGVGGNNNGLKAEITFSKEALLGFAINLLWMYEDIDPKKKIHIHIDPLLGAVPGNQALGFFLTPQSPSVVFCLNSINENIPLNIDITNFKRILSKHKFATEFQIKEPAVDESIEDYELGLNNMVQIRILDSNNNNVTKDGMEIIFNINYNGLKDFATTLLILANNYENGQEYRMAHAKQREIQDNLGVLLSEKSNEVILKTDYLGCVYNYDSHFGQS